jgi:geranylgeranyl pyrophosphate synthase
MPLNSHSKAQLFEMMKQTAVVVDAFMLDTLSEVSRDPLVPAEAILHLPKIRSARHGNDAHPKLRATFMRLIFEVLSRDDWKKVVPLAAVGELLAISSYVIDDFLDHQESRNGEPATWLMYGPADAIMAAQVQREVAERILLRLDTPTQIMIQLVSVLNNIFYEGYVGQLIDSRLKEPCAMGHYIRRCEEIAGHFHGGLAKMAAVFAKASEERIETIGRLGFYHGIALQIRNDLVDYIPSSILKAVGARALERTPFEDFRNGKWTMLLLHACENASNADQERLQSWIGKTLSEDIVINLTKILMHTGAYEATLQQITAYKEKAQQFLIELPSSSARNALGTLLETVENGRLYVQKLATALS